MKEYQKRNDAQSLVRANPKAFLGNIEEEPVVDLFADAGVRAIGDRQIELYRSKHPILRHLGGRTLRVLDVAPWYDPLGLYIASQGHSVTAIDIEAESVIWQNEAARKMGLDNFEARQSDVLDLASEPKYDVVIAGMLLHFMNKNDAEEATARIQAATAHGGLNAVSVYTMDNPEEEVTKRTVRPYQSVSELAEAYQAGWEVFEEYEGPRAHAVDRGAIIGESMVLLPTIAEVIARKIPVGSRLPDLSNIDDFDAYVMN